MYLYITSGTPEFMESIKKKHPNEQIYALHGIGNSVLIHETDKKSVFQAPRKYEIIEASGQLSKKGYFAIQNIPLSDEVKPIFEYKYTNLSPTLEREPGFVALRVLKPIKSDTYIILTEWSGPNSYEVWSKSHPMNFNDIADKQQFFTSAPYVSTYSSTNEED